MLHYGSARLILQKNVLNLFICNLFLLTCTVKPAKSTNRKCYVTVMPQLICWTECEILIFFVTEHMSWTRGPQDFCQRIAA